MINITNNKVKERMRVNQIRMIIAFENIFARQLAPKINGQFIRAAHEVANFNTSNVDFAIDETKSRLTEIYVINYIRIADEFSQMVFNSTMEIKGLTEDFWRIATNFFQFQALKRAKLPTETTKKVISKIIQKGFADGKSNEKIAKEIREKGKIANKVRAKTIAITETHSAAMYSMNTAAKTTKLLAEKEWIDANDSRVRLKPFNHSAAGGERVGINDLYQNTGEGLRFPGDFLGSAGNTILCRCGELYHTSPQIFGI